MTYICLITTSSTFFFFFPCFVFLSCPSPSSPPGPPFLSPSPFPRFLSVFPLLFLSFHPLVLLFLVFLRFLSHLFTRFSSTYSGFSPAIPPSLPPRSLSSLPTFFILLGASFLFSVVDSSFFSFFLKPGAIFAMFDCEFLHEEKSEPSSFCHAALDQFWRTLTRKKKPNVIYICT